MLTHGELFAGAGGFGLGFDKAGLDCRWQVEIDPWCQQVLRRHWPDVPRYADVRDVGAHNLEPVDVISFGSPCQDLSVAGQRAGLIGERSGLFHEAVRVIGELRPAYAVWENVPGALSSNGGRDFGAILDALADCGALDICWRILDARFFGVPQRRRRLFVVASFRTGASAFKVLVEPESCGGHPQARRETWEDVAPTLDDGARGVSVELPMIAYTLPASSRGTGDGHGNAWNGNYIANTLGSGGHSTNPLDETLMVASAVRASDGHHGHSSPRGDGADNLIAFHSKDHGQDADYNISPTVRAAENRNGGTPPAIAFSRTESWASGAGENAPSIRGGGNGAVNHPAISYAAGVRRLTPLECERLMGWPEDHTRWTADCRELPDSHRYRLCGNGVVAPVAEWLGHRLINV